MKLSVLSLLITGLVLVAYGALAAMRPTPADAEPYHARVRKVVEAFPKFISADNGRSWMGIDQKVPFEATKLLKPNITLSRSYKALPMAHEDNLDRTVSLLIVHCRDSRDMYGHWPPVCYTGSGWTLAEAHPSDWDLGTRKVHAIQYRFDRVLNEQPFHTIVVNFLLRPDGQIVPDMSGIEHTAKGFRTRFYGAGQVQIVVSAALPPEERDQIIQTFVTRLKDVIDTISPDPHAAEDAAQTTPGGNRE